MAGLALVFPGQGAYLAGLFQNMAEAPRVSEVLATVDAVAERHGGQLVRGYVEGTDPLSDEPPPDLAIFASEVACHAVLEQLGVTPDVHLGHSFGEWAALTCAGAVDLSDAVRLVCGRATILSASEVTGAMIALRTDARRAAHLVGLLDDGRLALAVDNGPEQAVLAGPADLVGLAEQVAADAGISVARLPLAYPFHTPAFVPAQRHLAALATDIDVRVPDLPVYSPILGRPVTTTGDVREIVRRHLSAPVGFHSALLTLHREGVRTFVECGARNTLTKIIERSLPSSVTVLAPWRQPATLQEVVATLGTAVASPTMDRRETTASTTDARTRPEASGGTEPVHSASRAGGAESAAQAVPPPAVRERPLPAAQKSADETVEPQPGPGSAAEAARGDRSVLVARLRAHYAEQLGFPEELLADETDLEADLGVDSIKQVELFQQMRQELRLPPAPPSLRITSYTTLPAIADVLREDTR